MSMLTGAGSGTPPRLEISVNRQMGEGMNPKESAAPSSRRSLRIPSWRAGREGSRRSSPVALRRPAGDFPLTADAA